MTAVRGLVWRKRFHSVEELTEALEEMGIWRSQQRVQHLGDGGGAGSEDVPIDSPPSKTERIMQANAEIELRLAQLKVQAWHWARLIEAYYCSGLSVQRNGWVVAAEYCGLHASVDSKYGTDRATFYQELEVAVKKLFHTRVR